MKSVDRKPAFRAEKDMITGDGAEQAVISFINFSPVVGQYKEGGFFDELMLIPGKYKSGNKLIEITEDDKEGILRTTAVVDGITRAVINSYNHHFCAAYFMLLGEANANGNRDELIYNREIYGGGEVELFSGPGLDLRQKELVSDPIQRREMATRLGVELNVQRPRILLIRRWR